MACDAYLVVKVDSSNVLAESNENNNVFGMPFPRPDLTITSTPSLHDALPISYSYTVTVRNIGNAAANLTGVVVQGTYGTDPTTYPGNAGACGVTMSGSLAAGGRND